MDALNNAFSAFLESKMTVSKLGSKLLADKFQEFGISLTQQQKDEMGAILERGDAEKYSIDINECLTKAQIAKLRSKMKDGTTIDISDKDFDKLDRELSNLLRKIIDERMEKTIPQVIKLGEKRTSCFSNKTSRKLEETSSFARYASKFISRNRH
jgi:hypothetical protein